MVDHRCGGAAAIAFRIFQMLAEHRMRQAIPTHRKQREMPVIIRPQARRSTGCSRGRDKPGSGAIVAARVRPSVDTGAQRYSSWLYSLDLRNRNALYFQGLTFSRKF
jgi:hypothetical protein